MKPDQPVLGFATAGAFRRWLDAHHAAHPGIWMQAAGLSAVDAAKADGRWARAREAPRDIEVPLDFLAALTRHPKASAFFNSLNRRNRSAIGALLSSARRPETRARRFTMLLAMLKRGQKLI
jgi:uncharacterized protein YdeI (YjbR/CyaY-like superfamily)